LVVVQFACHPERAFLAKRRIWAGCAMCRAAFDKKSSDTINARLARFLIKLHHYQIFEWIGNALEDAAVLRLTAGP
jgi:hypothetical protein